MQQGMARVLHLPKGLPTARYKPPPPVEIPEGVDELPLIDGKTPDNQKVQEVWEAHVRVFKLSDEQDLAEYQRVWQMIADGHAIQCEHRTEFVPERGEFVALLRWAYLRYKVPEGRAPGG